MTDKPTSDRGRIQDSSVPADDRGRASPRARPVRPAARHPVPSAKIPHWRRNASPSRRTERRISSCTISYAARRVRRPNPHEIRPGIAEKTRHFGDWPVFANGVRRRRTTAASDPRRRGLRLLPLGRTRVTGGIVSVRGCGENRGETFAHIHGRAELGVNFLTINSVSDVLIELNVVGKVAIRVEAHLP